MEQFEYYAKASKYTKALWLELSRLPACEHVKYNGSRYWTFVDEIDITRMQHAIQAVVNNNWDLRSNFFAVNIVKAPFFKIFDSHTKLIIIYFLCKKK